MPFLVVLLPHPRREIWMPTPHVVHWGARVQRRMGLWNSGGTPPADPGPLPVTNYSTVWGLDPAAQDSLLNAVLRGGTITAGPPAEISLWGNYPAAHEIGAPPYTYDAGNFRVDPGWSAPFATLFFDVLGLPVLTWASRNLAEETWGITHTLNPYALSIEAVGFYLNSVFQAQYNSLDPDSILIGTGGTPDPTVGNARVWAGNALWHVSAGDGDQILNAWLQGTAYTGPAQLYLSLLDGTDGEPGGAWAARQPITFGAPVAHVTTNTTPHHWTVGSAFSWHAFGVWSAATGGRLIERWILSYDPDPALLTPGDQIVLEAHVLYVTCLSGE